MQLFNRIALIGGLLMAAMHCPTARADDAAAAGQPAIFADSLIVSAYTVGKFQGSGDTWSWVPKVEFRVDGPIASGSQLYAQFKNGGNDWVKFDIPTEELKKGHWKKVSGGGSDADQDKGITDTGTFDFSIHIRNELASTDAELYAGHINVLKVHSNENGFPQHMVYYVDQDWTLPIGYVYLSKDTAGQMKQPTLTVDFWTRSQATNVKPHVFFDGKEIGKITMDQTQEMGAAMGDPKIVVAPSKFVAADTPQKATWSRVICTFPNVMAWNKGEPIQPLPRQEGTQWIMEDHPGQYEVKVLWADHLSRDIKFTIGDDGKPDDAVAKANNLHDDRAIVPVQILGDQDGTWNHDAYKTEAFYGHPLTGFDAAP